MKFCKRLAVASRKVSQKTLMKPMKPRSIIIKVFPTMIDFITHTHDLKDSMVVAIELEAGMMCLEISLILLSMSTKNMFKHKSSFDDSTSKDNCDE